MFFFLVKTDENCDASASSLSQVTQHTFACSFRQVPIKSMEHAFVTSTTKKHLVQGCKNAAARSHCVTKNVEWTNVFLLFILHAYECCMGVVMDFYKHTEPLRIFPRFCRSPLLPNIT